MEVFKALERDNFKVTYLNVDKEGYINLSELREALTPETTLVSIMYVNNEVGSIQPINEIAKVIKSKNKKTLFHVDAVQAFGKKPLVPSLEGIDLLSISGHKIYAPKGIGALFVQNEIRIEPMLLGGGQETGLRSGTENVPGIAGLGVAVDACYKNMPEWQSRVTELKKQLMDGILTEIPDTVLNGPPMGAPHILNISFLGTRGEIYYMHEATYMYQLDRLFFSQGGSHVLAALGKF